MVFRHSHEVIKGRGVFKRVHVCDVFRSRDQEDSFNRYLTSHSLKADECGFLMGVVNFESHQLIRVSLNSIECPIRKFCLGNGDGIC